MKYSVHITDSHRQKLIPEYVQRLSRPHTATSKGKTGIEIKKPHSRMDGMSFGSLKRSFDYLKSRGHANPGPGSYTDQAKGWNLELP